MYYGLSADRIKRVMRSPYRSEKGIAPDTIAVMQPVRLTSLAQGKPIQGAKGKQVTWKEEIWVMYALRQAQGKHKGAVNLMENLLGKKKVVITAWRYPGKSPIREAIPIPENILAELRDIKY